MSDKKVISFDNYVEQDDCRIEEVETARGIIKMGSASSKDIIEWFEEKDDPIKGKYAGLRLAIKCIINPDGTRIGDGAADKEALDAVREAALQKLIRHDSRENGALAKAALEVNGLRAKRDPKSPNVSSEALTDASHTDSPLPPVE